MSHSFSTRHSQPSPAALASLDFGLRVRIGARSDQRTIFSGAEALSVHQLTSELSELVSGLRIRSFALRAQIEHVTSALMLNAESGFWLLAQRAALDLAGLLVQAQRRHLADAELSFRGANCATRIAELCAREVR